jgi:hypothetical protein
MYEKLKEIRDLLYTALDQCISTGSALHMTPNDDELSITTEDFLDEHFSMIKHASEDHLRKATMAVNEAWTIVDRLMTCALLEKETKNE